MTLDSVPFLRSGTGSTPSEGGCVLQVADWIHRREWTDSPPCVHPVLRSFAITVNDRLPDDERQKLLDLIPRLLNTNTGDEVLTRKLLGYLARQVYPVYAEWARKAGYDDEGAVLACIEAAERGEAAKAAGAARAAEAAGLLPMLTGLLDHYDELTGRTEVESVDFTPVVATRTAGSTRS